MFMDSRNSVQTVSVAAKMHKASRSTTSLNEDIETVNAKEETFHAEDKLEVV